MLHWSEDPTPQLLVHRQHQQDALRHSWDGLVAGTDGSVDKHTEVMGAGYVLGTDPLPIISFFARVDGPLASARAEAGVPASFFPSFPAFFLHLFLKDPKP
jgi:hypothetical protein